MTAHKPVEAATLSSALVKALAEIEGAAKDKVNPHFKSKYADIGSVIDAIKPVLAKYELGFTQHPQPSDTGIIIETMLHHVSGGTLSLGTLYVPANKLDPQAFGSALTYARRYALMTAFGVPAEDDDGNAARTTNGAGKIDESQLRVLQSYATGGVIDLSRFCAFFQIPNLKELPATRYDEALRMAQAKQAKAKAPEPVA